MYVKRDFNHRFIINIENFTKIRIIEGFFNVLYSLRLETFSNVICFRYYINKKNVQNPISVLVTLVNSFFIIKITYLFGVLFLICITS